MSATILVTGSSGTVGTGLTLALLRAGYAVIPLDIKRSLWDKGIDRKTIFHDLRKPLDKLRLAGLPDLIVHLAANARVHDSVKDPSLARDNYLMTYNILEFARARGIKRILFSSSREIYGESRAGERRKEESAMLTAMQSPYTASKYGSEALLHSYHGCYGIKPVIARLSNVYGKYDVSERVIPLFIYYALRDRELTVFGKEKKLDFTYIDDCTNGLLQIVKRFDLMAGLTFNICTGRGNRIIDLAKSIIQLLDSRSKIRLGSKRAGEISSFVGDITLARKQLGYEPEVTLQQGLPLTVDWYRQVMKSRRVYNAQRRILRQRGWA
ncbi:MAG: NAD-dependent epimerase/dehydratase family protein [Candidatus Zixiibacteriota bacterium]